MGEAATRLTILLLLLGFGIFWLIQPESEAEATVTAPLLYEKGTYVGPRDEALSDEELNALRWRARNDFAPRL